MTKLKNERVKGFEETHTAFTSDFFKHFNTYISEKILEGITPNYVRRLKSCRNNILRFALSEGKDTLTFADIDRDFAIRFKRYRFENNRNLNTVSKDLVVLKAVVADAHVEHDMHVNEKYKSKAFKVRRVVTDSVALTLQEVIELHSIELDSKALTRAKDFFVFNCLTGLRFGDWRINESQIVEMQQKGEVKRTFLTIINQKTKRKIYIPLHRIALELLQKYKNDMQPTCNQVFNRNIKKVAQSVDLFERKVQLCYCERNEVNIKEFAMRERMTSHVARHTFIKIGLQELGIDCSTLASITGQSERQMREYVNRNDTSAAWRVARVFDTV